MVVKALISTFDAGAISSEDEKQSLFRFKPSEPVNDKHKRLFEPSEKESLFKLQTCKNKSRLGNLCFFKIFWTQKKFQETNFEGDTAERLLSLQSSGLLLIFFLYSLLVNNIDKWKSLV